MKKLVIERYADFENATLSHVSLFDEKGNRIYTCYGLEPAGPDTVESRQDRRIPVGEYQATWSPSTTAGNEYFKGFMPLIFNEQVSKSRLIRIHVGNFHYDTEGCLLLGTGANAKQGFVNNSRVAIKTCLGKLERQDFKVVIK